MGAKLVTTAYEADYAKNNGLPKVQEETQAAPAPPQARPMHYPPVNHDFLKNNSLEIPPECPMHQEKAVAPHPTSGGGCPVPHDKQKATSSDSGCPVPHDQRVLKTADGCPIPSDVNPNNMVIYEIFLHNFQRLFKIFLI